MNNGINFYRPCLSTLFVATTSRGAVTRRHLCPQCFSDKPAFTDTTERASSRNARVYISTHSTRRRPFPYLLQRTFT